LGKEKFAGVDIRVRVKGGGHIAQIYGMKLATYGVRILQITCWLFLHDADFSKIKYRNWIPEPGTTISGFVDNNKKKKINPDRPTLDFFDM
jgi:hypothetical protein